MENQDKNYQQLCCWPGITVGEGDIEKFEEYMLKELDVRVKYCEETLTNPDEGDTTGETGGRNDLLFSIHKDDVGKFAIPRLKLGIRWWEDVILYNDNKHLYKQEILDKYKPKW